MSREDLASLIVTDPDIVDEGIDISGLQTTTDTSPLLLANLEPGIQYDPTQQSVYSDLLSYFSGGLPMLPEKLTASNINIPLPGGGGSGGGGTVSATTTAPITSTTIPTTAPFIETSPNVLSATDPVTGQPTSGNIVDPKTGDVFAPGDYSDVAGTLADPKEKIDYTQDPEGFGNRVKTALLEGKDLVTEFGQGVADQITKIKDKGIDLGKLAGRAVANAIFPGLGFALDVIPERDPRQNKLDDLYDVKDGTIQSGLMAGYNPVSGGIPGISEPTFGLQDAYDKRIGTIENTLKDKYNMSDAEIADVKAGSYKGDVDTNLLGTLVDLEDAKKKEADVLGITAAEDKRLGEAEMRQTIADAVRQKDLGVGPRETIQPTTTKAQVTGVNPFEGVDIGFEGEFDLPTVNPFAPIEKREDALNYDATILDPYLQGEDEDLLDDLGYGQNITEDTYSEDPDAAEEVRDAEEKLADLETVREVASIVDRQPEVIEQKKNELADVYDRQVERGERDVDPTTTSKVNKAKAVIDMPPMLGDVGGSMDRDPAPPAPTRTVSRTDTDYGQFGRRQEATAAGGGNQGGGSRKIVCTMMNESYGFGSFRNKIWLKHSKSLAPEYQKGYHKIFLPLVRLSKTNKLLKKTLEHIAVHRTIDIRQEARGKVHLLGRIYRKILEPICYWVGKYAK